MCRTPLLDSYFALTANLGAHTFFMTALPILFWCGSTTLGRAMVHMLASGVFISGVLKDMVCIPRPLSPPLVRITMSKSAALEYGFPSTHSTNAVSVATYALYYLHTTDCGLSSSVRFAAIGIGYAYAASIAIGRLYCGMHGFFDVLAGGALGALMALLQIVYGEMIDKWVLADSFLNPLIITAVLLLAVRLHPEPADNCPCFDDSVAFAGVLIGIEFGLWHYSKTAFSYDSPVPGTVPFDLRTLGWLRTTARIVVGIVVVFMWRATMKPLLLRCLPPIFRIIDHLGFILPRRYFMPADQYELIPPLRKDDNVIPSASDLPGFITSLRHPRRRAISIGPQSEADAHEVIASREQRRRASMSQPTLSPLRRRAYTESEALSAAVIRKLSVGHTSEGDQRKFTIDAIAAVHGTKGSGIAKTHILADAPPTPPASDASAASDSSKEEERLDREMFSQLEKPRVRYDVEVVTKLVIYAGQ
ncbi:hypothetical protein LTR28_011281 [Elasticomyces elasticus]|nr:hypothetical protein LTR28_011281 [Elasticomyces elasticus]